MKYKTHTQNHKKTLHTVLCKISPLLRRAEVCGSGGDIHSLHEGPEFYSWKSLPIFTHNIHVTLQAFKGK